MLVPLRGRWHETRGTDSDRRSNPATIRHSRDWVLTRPSGHAEMVLSESQSSAAKRAANEERRRELAELERDVSHRVRRLYMQTIGGCMFCCALGLLLAGWSMHTNDPGWGAIALWSGLLVGDGGVLVLLIRHFRRSDELG